MGGDEEVKLYGMWASPAVRRVEWALKMKGVEYQYIEEDLAKKSHQLLEHNPINKQVPVLLHNGLPVLESLVIIEYIDETWKGNPILPIDPYQRASARFWATFAETKLLDGTKAIFLAQGEEKVKAIKKVEDTLKVLEEELRGKKFFGGESIGYLDIVLGWIALWLGVGEEVADYRVLDAIKFPKITSWIENFLHVDLIKENIPDRQHTLEFFHNFRRFGFAIPNK
ncbi:hypothetical protein J5N97_003689 [Dioscorea zingiberensis]|uniref:glutathione transferase n=1 Tax=Dioscorea zingiberensis TaxID=325984 RepID=A0A9D5D557_9LILI|nr:hypothetical protein J5N97_003689 [Dioscorea zingiberensis]